MQTYLGSPTPTKTGGGIIMANVNTVTTTSYDFSTEQFLDKLGIDLVDSDLIRVGLSNNRDGKPFTKVVVTLKSEQEEVNA